MKAKKLDKLYEVILGANYLGIVPLVQLGCSQIAVIVKGKRLEEVDKLLGLKDNKPKAPSSAV